MNRRNFAKQTGLLSAGLLLGKNIFARYEEPFATVRVALAQRKFSSKAIENAISHFQISAKNKELAWLFGNCFPNTLDTTVDFTTINGKPDTYVITGDIDAMWLRDSTAQVWPYLPFALQDMQLQLLIAGVVNRQVKCILKDPYANAFYKDETKVSEWKESDITDMKPGIHERKWEVDSLCYPIRLSYGYWKTTGDKSIFDEQWLAAAKLIVQTFTTQQRWSGSGPYSFQRRTSWATDGVPLAGFGYPCKPNGLIHQMFRPSDDATVFAFNLPGNFFAATILGYMKSIVAEVYNDVLFAKEISNVQMQIQKALNQVLQNAKQQTGYLKNVIPFETNGLGSNLFMDDANIPSLLSLPYLDAIASNDPLYQKTRAFVLSGNNPFFFKGKAGEGVGGPHVGVDYIWPLSIIMRALTSNDAQEIKTCLDMLQKSNANTGFMHEAFQKEDTTKFTRTWFAWANTLFGELLLKVQKDYPNLL